jgi:nucleotide-binding universal stress UspA family protein
VQHETEAYAHEFLARHVLGAPQARLELRIGVPATEVLRAIESISAELVAVGWPHTSDPGRGAVAREILDRSPVPVLLVAVTE